MSSDYEKERDATMELIEKSSISKDNQSFNLLTEHHIHIQHQWSAVYNVLIHWNLISDPKHSDNILKYVGPNSKR